MTREDAIEHLKGWKEVISSGYRKAVIDMAIDALSANTVQGEWIRVGHDIYECSLCHQNVMTRDIDCYAYCHRCGARMKGADDE